MDQMWNYEVLKVICPRSEQVLHYYDDLIM